MDSKAELETSFAYLFLRIVLYALLLTPLWVWSIFLFPFITTKVLYFRLLVEIALVLYLFLALRFPELRPRKSWLLVAVWIYLGVIFVTSFFGVDFYRSFWGTVERGEGIVTLLHFAIFFTILPAVFRTSEEWYRYLRFALLATLLVGLYAIGQLADLPFVIQAGESRISGTIGNAAFFAAFMIFGIFLSFYLGRQSVVWSGRLFFYGAFLLELFLLFKTQTRGAVLALVGAFLLYLLVSSFMAERLRSKVVSVALVLLIFGGALVIYVNRHSAWVKDSYTLSRFISISPSDITAQSRLDTWRASWKAFKDHVFLGYGYENYQIAFNRYFPARIFKDQGSQIWFDRAHNLFFDVVITSGIVGFIAYLGIFLAAFQILVKLVWKKSQFLNWRYPVIFGVLLAGYFFQNLFVFDTQATYLMFFLVLGYLIFLENFYLYPERKPIFGSSPVLSRFWFAAPAIIMTVVVAYFVNLKPALANASAIRGIKAANAKLDDQIRPNFTKALSYKTYMDQEIRQRLADYSLQALGGSSLAAEEKASLYQYIIEELQKSIKESPRDAKNYLYLMSVYNQFPTQTQFADETLALGEKALALSPTRPQIYFELGKAYLAKKDWEQGLLQFRTALDLYPEPRESYFNYLLAGILANREDIVSEETKILLEKKHYEFTVQDFLAVGRAYFQAGKLDKVVEIYEAAVRTSPNNAELHAKLAAAYGEICDLEHAKLHVDQTITLNTSFLLEGKSFLRQLETKCRK